MSNQTMTNIYESRVGSFKTINHINGRFSKDIVKDAIKGLTAQQKYIPCKYFYDAYGSKLFDDICYLPEYYQTRTEMSILQNIAPDLMSNLLDYDLVELGSGANHKINILLDAISEQNRSTLRYIPVDISESALIEASRDLLERYPELHVFGIVADFISQLHLLPADRSRLFCFLGSTVGNMENKEAVNFLQNISQNMTEKDKLLIGFDMVKPEETVAAAYNDSQGVTSEFNKNVLNVLNRELMADFNPDHFDHMAFYNRDYNRIEMHLKANCDASIKLRSLDMKVDIKKGETIHTENSRKFTEECIRDLALQAELSIQNCYSDADGWFSLAIMTRKCRNLGDPT